MKIHMEKKIGVVIRSNKYQTSRSFKYQTSHPILNSLTRNPPNLSPSDFPETGLKRFLTLLDFLEFLAHRASSRRYEFAE